MLLLNHDSPLGVEHLILSIIGGQSCYTSLLLVVRMMRCKWIIVFLLVTLIVNIMCSACRHCMILFWDGYGAPQFTQAHRENNSAWFSRILPETPGQIWTEIQPNDLPFFVRPAFWTVEKRNNTDHPLAEGTEGQIWIPFGDGAEGWRLSTQHWMQNYLVAGLRHWSGQLMVRSQEAWLILTMFHFWWFQTIALSVSMPSVMIPQRLIFAVFAVESMLWWKWKVSGTSCVRIHWGW